MKEEILQELHILAAQLQRPDATGVPNAAEQEAYKNLNTLRMTNAASYETFLLEISRENPDLRVGFMPVSGTDIEAMGRPFDDESHEEQ
jgi:hypothetical protein